MWPASSISFEWLSPLRPRFIGAQGTWMVPKNLLVSRRSKVLQAVPTRIKHLKDNLGKSAMRYNQIWRTSGENRGRFFRFVACQVE